LAKNPVAIEKLHLPPEQPKFEGYKMPRKLRTSFVGHPGAILFWRISRAGIFQQSLMFASNYAPPRPEDARWERFSMLNPLDNEGGR
jgi:hypothetical protein